MPLGFALITVLRRKVGDDQVGVVDGIVVALVGRLHRAAGFIIGEFIENAEGIVVGVVLAGGIDIVGCVVQDYLLRVVDTFGAGHVVNVLGIHIGKGSLRIGIGSIVVGSVRDTLLGNVKILFAGNGDEGKS